MPIYRRFPGLAVCDWLPKLKSDLNTYHPAVVLMAFAGDSATQCMMDRHGKPLVPGSSAYLARYRADINAFFEKVTATGAEVVFVEYPPLRDPGSNAALTEIIAIAKTLAGHYQGVSIATTVRSQLSQSGRYIGYAPCLHTESVQMGCTHGHIAIRTNVSGPGSGIHLCPVVPPNVFPWRCPIYSSGEYRFGTAIAATAMDPPRPIVP
jgi:hypothetical protein